ncbi:MAG TPA: acetate--CoA ligase family protein [Candidatus Acidoferrum sp.]|nr:acetate--CoA ligase family protein [Candidatus Acidoferrum sp.]
MLRPNSIAVVGVSSQANSTGATVVANIIASDYKAALYIVSRNANEIEGRACLKTMEALPEGVDLVVCTVPSAAVRETIEACVKRKVHAAVVFASGFAELGDAGRTEQEAIAKIAAEGEIALLGPNCLGFTNCIDGFGIGFAGRSTPKRTQAGPAVALVAQSGALMGHFTLAFDARNLPVTYSVSTGNEAGLGIEDFVEYLANDAATRAIVVFAEQIRRPRDFLAALARCRECGKPVVLFHPGRSVRSRESARSHTGAMSGEHAVMRTFASHAGAVVVESLEELVDVAEILARFPKPPTAGVGVVTVSGAFCGVALDLCDEIGLDVPALAPKTEAALKSVLPPFAKPSNPLDLTTQPIREPELLSKGLAALLADPGIGSVVVAIMPGPAPPQTVRYLKGLHPAIKNPAKPVVLAMMGDGSPLVEECSTLIRESGIALSRSPERSLRAVARVTEFGRTCAASESMSRRAPVPRLPPVQRGTMPEYAAKKYLAGIGIQIPEGELARDVEDATCIATRIGYPVVLKAQHASLEHKSDIGGVAVGIANEADLRRSWTRVTENVRRARPDLRLERMLVEKMAAPGLEIIVGAKRDPHWGPVLLVGLGGIWTEALKDVRLLPPDLSEGMILTEIAKLKGYALLRGARGSPPRDCAALARTVVLIGGVMLARPELTEIDINPLVVYEENHSCVALDALIVSA